MSPVATGPGRRDLDGPGPDPKTDGGVGEGGDPLGGESTHGDAATLARGGALNFVGMITYGGFNFLLILLVTRGLGAAGAGAFLEAIGLFNILSKSVVLGADAGLVRFIPRLRAQHRTEEVGHAFRVAVIPVVVLAAVVGAVVFASAAPLAGVLSNGGAHGDLTTYVQVLSVFLPFGAVYLLLESGTRGFATMVPSVAVERIARPAAQPLLMLFVLSAGLGSAAIALSWVGPFAVALVPMGVWAVSLLHRAVRTDAVRTDAARPGQVPPGPHPPLVIEFWRFSAPRALGGISQVLTIWLDALLIGALASTREAGIYAASTRWLIIGSFGGLALVQAIGPQLSHVLTRGEGHRAHHLFEVSTAWGVLVAFPAYLTVMVFAPALLEAFGEGFGSGRDALVILGAANLFAAACGPVEMVLLMAGRSTQALGCSLFGLLVNIALNVALVPHLGITGAALAWMASLVITNALPLLMVYGALGVHPFGRRWAHAVVLAGLGVGIPELATRLLLGESLVALVVAVAAAGAVYAALLVAFRSVLDLDDFVAALRHRPRRASRTTAPAS